MAVLTAEGISGVALELLTRSLVLPRTAARPPGSEFSGPNGATITVRVRQSREAQEQLTPGAPIEYIGVDEQAVDVTLHHYYDATRITDEDMSMSIADFSAQITAPQVAAIATGAENEIASALNALEPVHHAGDDPDDIEDTVLRAREDLTRNQVPLGNRWLAVSPEFATPLLKADKFSRIDASGSPSALRDAVLGRIYGMTVVESPGLDAGTAHAYHSSGLLFANRPPAIPNGAASAALANLDGIALRVLFDFDPGVLSDVTVVSTFAGASIVYEDGNDGDDLMRIIPLAIAGS